MGVLMDLVAGDAREILLAGELVEFCRHAEGAEDILFAWSL